MYLYEKFFSFKILKEDINSKVTGIASSAVREKMVSFILSERFPSVEYCNMYQSDGKVLYIDGFTIGILDHL